MRDKLKNLWLKIEDRVGQIIVILAIVILSPALFVIGGCLLPVRVYWNISSTVNNKTPKKYFY